MGQRWEYNMLLQPTIEKLYDLRLKVMAEALREQMETGNYVGLSFEERFGLLVDREWDSRKNKRTQRRIKDAKLKVKACVEDIDYQHPRGLAREVMLDLVSCRWVRAQRNVIFCGPTGVGKTWLACSLAHQACREGLTVSYVRVPRLFHELTVAQGDGSYLQYLRKLAKKDLIILDDLGLSPMPGESGNQLLEVLDDRVGNRSTLVTSQLPVTKWHELLDEPTVADAILDRLLGRSIQIHLKGESMR
jgi:DNA replication protein DnaC